MKIPKHTSLSLAGNVPIYEHSNKVRSSLYDKPDISPYSALSQQGGMGHKRQSGKGFVDDVFTVAGAVADVTSKKSNQNGKGFWADVIGGAAGGLGAIVGSVGGPIGAGALGAAAGYGGKKFAEQYGLGYQYKSKNGSRGMWGTSSNSLGPVSQNMPISL